MSYRIMFFLKRNCFLCFNMLMFSTEQHSMIQYISESTCLPTVRYSTVHDSIIQCFGNCQVEVAVILRSEPQKQVIFNCRSEKIETIFKKTHFHRINVEIYWTKITCPRSVGKDSSPARSHQPLEGEGNSRRHALSTWRPLPYTLLFSSHLRPSSTFNLQPLLLCPSR